MMFLAVDSGYFVFSTVEGAYLALVTVEVRSCDVVITGIGLFFGFLTVFFFDVGVNFAKNESFAAKIL